MNLILAKSIGFADQKKVRECLVCHGRFSQVDVSLFLFHPDTNVCHECYSKMKSSDDSCFGKQYDGSQIDCFKYCPDRRVCQRYQEQDMAKIVRLAGKNRAYILAFLRQQKIVAEKRKPIRRNENHPFKKGTLIRACFDKCVKGTTIKGLKKYCELIGADFQTMFRQLHLQARRQWEWKWIEDDEDGTIRIEFEQEQSE